MRIFSVYVWQMYIWEGPGDIKIWKSTNLGYDIFHLNSYDIKKNKITFRDFGETHISVKPVDPISVL
jgi:hypothetical protein